MKRLSGLTVAVLVALLMAAGVAVAEEHDEEPEATFMHPVVVVDEGVVYIALPLDGELPEECLPADEDAEGEGGEGEGGEAPAPDEGVEGEGGDDGSEEPEVVMYAPGDCIEVDVDHPSGKMHHGAIVSSVAKALHPSMLDGIKKGHIMRHVAKTGEMPDVDGDGDGDGEELESVDAKAAQDAAKAERKAARDEAKAERKAARDEAKATRNAAKAERKAARGR